MINLHFLFKKVFWLFMFYYFMNNIVCKCAINVFYSLVAWLFRSFQWHSTFCCFCRCQNVKQLHKYLHLSKHFPSIFVCFLCKWVERRFLTLVEKCTVMTQVLGRKSQVNPCLCVILVIVDVSAWVSMI